MDMDKVFNIGITLVILYASGTVLSILQGQIMAVVTQKISKNLRNEISEKINRLPMWYYNTTSTGDILSRVTNDVDMIGQSLNMSVGMLISSVTLLLGSVFMMFKTNVLMTVTAILSSLFGFALMMIIMGKSQKYFKRQQKHLGEINGPVSYTHLACMRKTKIICTLGPAVDSDERITQIINAGMDCARLNFSHGTHEEQEVRLNRVRRIAGELNRHIPILLDTKGPEIRLKDFENGSVVVEKGSLFTFDTDKETPGTKERIGLTYDKLAKNVEVGTKILVDDGKIELKVTAIKGSKAVSYTHLSITAHHLMQKMDIFFQKRC